jgi:hypothetical protein
MGKVSASSSIDIPVAPEAAIAALTDYETVRPRILTSHFRDYKVVTGGQGEGTIAEWILQATESRSRNIQAVVTVSGNTITESDTNSSLVTTYTVESAGAGSKVTTLTEWTGAGGVGGFFEKTFAPLGLKKIQAELLSNLASELA